MRKKNLLKELSTSDMSNRVRGFLLDSQIQHPHDLAVIVGCSPISDEVADREEEESENRLAKVSYLIPVLFAYAHTMAEAATEFQKAHSEVKTSEDTWKYSRTMTEQISMAVLLGAVSQMVDMGLLEPPKGMFNKSRRWKR